MLTLRTRWRQWNSIGRRGERIAARHLRRCGLRILARNLRIRSIEIDIVALDPVRDELVVIEVKTSLGTKDATQRIDRRKRRRLQIASACLCSSRPVRVEAIGVNLGPPLRIRRHGAPADQPGR